MPGIARLFTELLRFEPRYLSKIGETSRLAPSPPSRRPVPVAPLPPPAGEQVSLGMNFFMVKKGSLISQAPRLYVLLFRWFGLSGIVGRHCSESGIKVNESEVRCACKLPTVIAPDVLRDLV